MDWSPKKRISVTALRLLSSREDVVHESAGREEEEEAHDRFSSSSASSSFSLSFCSVSSSRLTSWSALDEIHLLEKLVELISHIISTLVASSNHSRIKLGSAVPALESFKESLRFLEANNELQFRVVLKRMDIEARQAFAASSKFKEKLLATKLSMLSSLYFNNYFIAVDEQFTDSSLKALSLVSELFRALLETKEVKNAISDEYETREVSTSIWLKLSHKNHVVKDQSTLAEIFSLKRILETLFPKGILDESFFEVRNSHGAIVPSEAKQLRIHSRPVAALTATAEYLISGSKDKTIAVWSLKTHELLALLEGHGGEITEMIPFVDGSRSKCDMLFSSCSLGNLILWDISILSQCAIIDNFHSNSVSAMAISSGKLFSADVKGVMKAWNICMIGSLESKDSLEFSRQAHRYKITSLVASDTRVYSSGYNVKVWDSSNCDLLHKVKMHSGLTTALFIRGKVLYSGSRSIKLWDTDSLQRLESKHTMKHSHPVTAIAVFDEKRLFSAAHVIKEWNLDHSEATSVFREHDSLINSMAICKNTLYSASDDSNSVLFWSIEDTSSLDVECVNVEEHSNSIL